MDNASPYHTPRTPNAPPAGSTESMQSMMIKAACAHHPHVSESCLAGTRAYYQNLHMTYRFGNTSRGMNGPVFSREFCAGSNGNGIAFRQDMAIRPATTITPLNIQRARPPFGEQTLARLSTAPFSSTMSSTMSSKMSSTGSSISSSSPFGNQEALGECRPRNYFQMQTAFPGGPKRVTSSMARYL